MKLYTAKATPYGRTVEIVAHELGLHEELEIVATTVSPTRANDAYKAVNPLRKIPALALDDGTVLTDSSLIAQYLAARVGDTHLFGVNAPHRWAMLNDYMIAKGMTDCLIAARYEGFVRPKEHQWRPWLDDQMDKAHAALARFEAAPPAGDGRLSIAALALGAALGYLDFRFAEEAWRDRYPALARWAAPIHERPSFQATMPQ